MGEVASALIHARQMKQAVAGPGDTSDPGVQLPQDPLASVAPNVPDFGMQGQNNAQPQDPGTSPIQALFGMNTPDSQPSQPVPDQAPPVVDNPYTNYDPSDVAKSVPDIGTPDDDSVTVTGDPYTPKKESTLGRIADTLLQLRGRDPIFQQRTDDANLQTAMQGRGAADRDVLIRRVAQFNPELAYKMQTQWAQQKRQDANLDRQTDATNLVIENAVRGRAASMAATLGQAKNPQQAWPILRDRIINYGSAHGIDFSKELPTQYNDFDVQAFQNGGMSLPQNERIQQGDRRLDQGDTRLQQTGEDTNSRVRARADRTRQGDQRLQQQASKNPQEKVIATPHGNMVVRGNKGVIITPDGMAHQFITNDGSHWVHVNTVPTKGVKQ